MDFSDLGKPALRALCPVAGVGNRGGSQPRANDGQILIGEALQHMLRHNQKGKSVEPRLWLGFDHKPIEVVVFYPALIVLHCGPKIEVFSVSRSRRIRRL